MPITIHPSRQPLSSVDTTHSRPVADSKDLLAQSCKNVFDKCGEIFQSSFAASSSSKASEERFAVTNLSKSVVCPVNNGNGLVSTAVQAYNLHHHLVLRPDDVWIAILSQFNLYVNANAKRLRHVFVKHKGQKALVVRACGSRYDVDFGAMAAQMGKVIQENVKDPELHGWIIPNFSTTTDNDRIVSSVLMMATLKAFFGYELSLTCGLPGVTLLGEKADWETLLTKVDKLPSYGEQTAQWHTLLKPVLAAFVRSFEEPDADRVKDFWQSIAHYSGGGSGPTFLSGWITAFCFFDEEGKPLYSSETVGQAKNWDGEELGYLDLDGVGYHRLDTDKIPPAYAEVDVKLDDNGYVIKTVMVAGLVGTEITSSGIRVGDHEGRDDTVQPVAGWWLFEKASGKGRRDWLRKLARRWNDADGTKSLCCR